MFKRSKSISLTVLVVLAAMLVGGMVVQAEQITLTVLNYMDATSPGTERELNEIWAEFERRNPDIKVVREDLFNEPFHQKTEAYAAANTLPDVIYMWPGGRSTTLHTQGLVKDLRPLLGDMADEFSEAALVPQAAGTLAELPSGVTATHVLYVNETMLNELGLAIPKTYEELVAMVPVLKAAGKDTIIMGAQDDWVIQSTLFSMLAGRLLGDEYWDQLVAGTAKFTDKPFVNALKFYEQLYKDGVLTRRNLQTSYSEVNGLFAQGRAPFMIDGDWKVGNFLTDATTGEALISPEDQKGIRMTVFPAIPGEVISNTTSTTVGTGFGINAKIPAGSAKEAAAWKLVSWLQSPEVQRIRLETGGSFPSRKGITADNMEPMQNERALFYGNHNGTYVIDSIFEGPVYTPMNIGLQELALGFTTAEDVAATVQKAYDAWKASK